MSGFTVPTNDIDIYLKDCMALKLPLHCKPGENFHPSQLANYTFCDCSANISAGDLFLTGNSICKKHKKYNYVSTHVFVEGMVDLPRLILK